MEQKRIIWIAAAVGIFLLVVIGAALLLYSPGPAPEPSVASLARTDDTWALPVQPKSEEIVSELNVRAGTANVYTESATTITLNAPTSDITTVKDPETPKPETSAAATNTPDQIPSAPVVEIIAPRQSATKAPEVPTPPAPVKTTTAKPATTQTAAKPAAVKVTVTEYWVQTASLNEKKFADQAQDRLAQNKISSEIFTTEKNGKMFFRVRAGPYKTKSEAEWWLGLIKEDAAFTESYITEVKAQR